MLKKLIDDANIQPGLSRKGAIMQMHGAEMSRKSPVRALIFVKTVGTVDLQGDSA
ncbi:hypothetical protein [uncultured Duncaniella sp.]|uniref:hypothetical protein n=1 Tax=uncultured Duncaniella sp. TaxID=2768039 RepID=UPI0026494CBE|nr:hypothetical protein [uncultured Duncaniella sp.]